MRRDPQMDEGRSVHSITRHLRATTPVEGEVAGDLPLAHPVDQLATQPGMVAEGLLQGLTDLLLAEHVNGGGKVQRGAGEMGDTRYPSYLPDGLLSMDCGVTPSGEAGSPAGERRRRLASRSR